MTRVHPSAGAASSATTSSSDHCGVGARSVWAVPAERISQLKISDVQTFTNLAAETQKNKRSTAERLYSQGLAQLSRDDYARALPYFEKAAEADPKFPLVHAMLARAWGQLGYKQKHQEEAKKAFDLSADLPRALRLLVEGEYHERVGKQEQAASVYHALFEPRNRCLQLAREDYAVARALHL